MTNLQRYPGIIGTIQTIKQEKINRYYNYSGFDMPEYVVMNYNTLKLIDSYNQSIPGHKPISEAATHINGITLTIKALGLKVLIDNTMEYCEVKVL